MIPQNKKLSMNNKDYLKIFERYSVKELKNLAQKYQTPLYLYDEVGILEKIQAYKNHPKNPQIHYAVKANSNLSLLSLMAKQGLGFDIVSQGELIRVLKAGGKAEQIIFSGVAKTNAELQFALEQNIGCFNVESFEELVRLNELANKLGKIAKIAARVNPNVDAKTHPYISTGLKENKFGIALEEAENFYLQANKLKNIEIIGVAAHIGSQICELQPFLKSLESIKNLADKLVAQGIKIKHLDLGGGLGVESERNAKVPEIQDYLNAIFNYLGDSYELHLEPGRSIVANNAILLSEVVAVKKQSDKKFIILDAAMNDYIRVALYEAITPMINLDKENKETGELADIVGGVCESTDCFRKNYELSAKTGDLIALLGVGAYGMSMASNYNSRLKPAEVLINPNGDKLIRKRDNYEDLMRNEQLEVSS